MARVQVKRAYQYRFYPTEVQRRELLCTFGCVRTVYNLALDARTCAWFVEQRWVHYNETSAMLAVWKKTDALAFLGEVSSVLLQQALRHLQGAFAVFFDRRGRYPRFKSCRKSRASAEYTKSGVPWCEGTVRLAKMSEPLDMVWSWPLSAGAGPFTVTVSCDVADRWFVSLFVDTSVEQHVPAASAVGVDAGLCSLVTLSIGEKLTRPQYEKRGRARLAQAQRVLACKQQGSHNRVKARRTVARVHACITDRRRDQLHRVSARLVCENQTVVIEDFQVWGMLGNGTLARAVSEASWSEFRTMLEYKAAWYGREVIAVDQWFPSSKTCSCCGRLAKSMPLNIREWTCGGCHARHDRDLNVACTILAAGLAVSACGAGVRPQRESSRTGQSAVKQELSGASRKAIPRL